MYECKIMVRIGGFMAQSGNSIKYVFFLILSLWIISFCPGRVVPGLMC